MTFAEWNESRFGPGRDTEHARTATALFLLVLMCFNLGFIAFELPQCPQGMTYELWTIPPGGKPIPAGVVDPNQEGDLHRAVFGRAGHPARAPGAAGRGGGG